MPIQLDPVTRGQRAQAILNDDLWKEAWSVLEQRLVGAMLAAKTDEGTLRGKQLCGLMEDLRRHFERAIKDGQIAEHQIKLDAEEKRRKFRLFGA